MVSARLLLLFTTALRLVSSQADTDLQFSYALVRASSSAVYGVGLESTVPAVDLALALVNNNSNLLPNINFTYGQVSILEVGVGVWV